MKVSTLIKEQIQSNCVLNSLTYFTNSFTTARTFQFIHIFHAPFTLFDYILRYEHNIKSKCDLLYFLIYTSFVPV